MKNLRNGFLLALTSLYMVACSSAPEGEQVETQEAQEIETVTAEAQTLQVSIADSKINWVGTKPAGEHKGTLNVSDGELRMMDGNLIGGKFVLDMASIEVTDLEGDEKAGLEGHLKGTSEEEKMDHFFNVKTYPTAVFEIAKLEPVEGVENVTHNITGNLTMRDITKAVTLPANVTFVEGVLTAVTPQFTIDRTEWGIEYKSSKLGDMAINDNLGIQINLQAK